MNSVVYMHVHMCAYACVSMGMCVHVCGGQRILYILSFSSLLYPPPSPLPFCPPPSLCLHHSFSLALNLPWWLATHQLPGVCLSMSPMVGL